MTYYSVLFLSRPVYWAHLSSTWGELCVLSGYPTKKDALAVYRERHGENPTKKFIRVIKVTEKKGEMYY